MNDILTVRIIAAGKTLQLFCVSLHGEEIPGHVRSNAEKAFKSLAPYLKNDDQVLYIRDIKFLAIDEKYVGGHCYNAYEAMIATPSWQADEEQFIATINHELHHMARWQNPGYGETLGGAILSEGIATYYEELVSGWSSPWSQVKVSQETIDAAKKEWDNAEYNHSEWFFEGPHGKWAGYGIGYQLAKKLFADGFDLERSILITPDEARSSI